VLAAAGSLESCSSSPSYDSVIAQTYRPFDGHLIERNALNRELVRYATLAPSSHNTQCWKFEVGDRHVSIVPDFTRRLQAVDSDDHHLFGSLGCATENLEQAARANGLRGNVRLDPLRNAVRVAFEPAKPVVSPLFGAIPLRQCPRAPYDGKTVPAGDLRTLEAAAGGTGVRILSYVVHGNTAQLSDPAFMDELRGWFRFNAADAIAKGDGLSSLSSGNPQLPRWLGDIAFKYPFTPKSENEKYANLIRSSAGIAVFVTDANGWRHWIEAGRSYERFALATTALGIRTSMVNQPVEVARLRADFARLLDVGHYRPDVVVRFGYGPAMPQSRRRSIDDVIV